ncbi:coproporphyrinogen III oxidase [Bacteroidia bacterium]|nr:coproporphyrinogen III oxidase [Bacteroidia bacterium]
MLGIYFHIPFCQRKCAYCDFYSVTDKSLYGVALAAMMKEMEQRKDEFSGIDTTQATIYFGGGTPSLLTAAQIKMLAQKAIQTFDIQQVAEFTIEVNPDDVTLDYLASLRGAGANRLSIGVQSFVDNDLQQVQRRHTAQQAIDSIASAKKTGFNNISIDLMYGLPSLTLEHWQQNLQTAFALDIQHLSAYCLSVEPHTPLGKWLQAGKIALPNEDEVTAQYQTLLELSRRHGFEHYEISNFARPNCRAQHNTAYWQGTPYVGIGAAAHSYNGKARRANVANVLQYIQGVEQNSACFEHEILSPSQQYNELIFTGLRTRWGVDLSQIEHTAGGQFVDFFVKQSTPLLQQQQLIQTNAHFTIPQHLWFIADSIILKMIF